MSDDESAATPDVVPPPLNVPRLSDRQVQLLRFVGHGLTSKEIARETGLAVGTVDVYIQRAVAKLGARGRRDAARRILAADENTNHVSKFELDSTGVDPIASSRLPTGRWVQRGDQLAMLPLRAKGAIGNDLSRTRRTIAIVFLILAFTIGFGMLAAGVRVVSDLVGVAVRR